MRLAVLPVPGESELRLMRVHEVIRDYPESLPILESLGLDPGEVGGSAMTSVLPADGSWVPLILEKLSWRATAQR